MTAQFGRVVRLTIQTRQITGLDVSFRVKKTLAEEPNTAEIRVFNLSAQSRALFEASETQPVILEVGYEKPGVSRLFAQDVRRAYSAYRPPDWVTTVRTADKEDKIASAQINRAFVAGTSVAQILQELTDALGVDPGNSAPKFGVAQLRGLLAAYTKGVTLSGSAYKQLQRMAKSAGLEVTVADGQLQVLNVGQALENTAVKLTPDTGLIGSPEPGAKGLIKMRALLNPAIFPGRKVLLNSRSIRSALYRVEEAEYIGDTAGDDWYVDIQGREINA